MSLYSWVNGFKFGGDHADVDSLPSDQRGVARLLGIFAADIRSDWNDRVDTRLNVMLKLCERLGRQDWAQELEEHRDDIYDDGRWLRDCWSGPYIDEVAKPEDVGAELYDEFGHLLHYHRAEQNDSD